MLHVVSTSLPDPVVTHPSDNERNKLIKECLGLAYTILSLPSHRSVIGELFQWRPPPIPTPAEPFVSASSSTQLQTPSKQQTQLRLGNSVVALIRSTPHHRQPNSVESEDSFARLF